MARPTQRPAGHHKTLFEKIWDAHAVSQRDDGQTLLYVDCHLLHEGSRLAFDVLRQKGLGVRRPDRTFATPDHYVATKGKGLAAIADPERRGIVEMLDRNLAGTGIALFGMDDPRRGIVHILGPEQGLSRPGMTVVCGDSHTATHGAVGALGFGIGASEVAHVLATQTLWQRKPRSMRIVVKGMLGYGITAKDVILAIIGKIGTAGAVGHVVEYAGPAIRSLSMEARFTVCNMSIEAGARAGLIAPDDATFDYLEGRPFSPKGKDWDDAVARWRALPSDPEARFDRELVLDGSAIAPMVTWGTSPEDALPITGRVPDPSAEPDPARRQGMIRALDYMGLQPGAALDGIAVDHVFIGSCTNSRIEDLRAAATVANGRHVAPGVQAAVVPGSGLIKAAAEQEGLDRVFVNAGFEWREAGCSTCAGTNGEVIPPFGRCASTSNRNFVGRQGTDARTHLMSPAMAAAAAVTGRLTDVRRLG